MYARLLQDWVTIQGASTSGPISQTELFWLDTSAFLDLVTWLEVKDVSPSSSIYLAYQTAPTKDEALFTPMNDVSPGAPGTLAVGVTVGTYLRDTALCPLSHWLRWQLIPPAATPWQVTFRIWVSLNQPGGLARALAHGQGRYAGGGPAWTPGGPAPGIPPKPKYGELPQAHSQQHAPQPLDIEHAGAHYGGGNPFAPVDFIHATGHQVVKTPHSRYLVRSGPGKPLVHYHPASYASQVEKTVKK